MESTLNLSLYSRFIKHFIIFSLFALISTNSFSHTRSQSFSTWVINEHSVDVTLSILSREITRLAADETVDVTLSLENIFIQHIQQRMSLSTDGKQCNDISNITDLPANNGYIRLEASFNCPVVDSIEIEFGGFFDLVPSHLHYAHIKPNSGLSYELVFSDADRLQTIHLNQEQAGLWSTSINYIALGIEHILIGTDHLVFLLALLLLCRTFKQVILLITGFTLGHSLTLILSVLGWLQPNMIIIEAMIGFSIVLVALELLQKKNGKSLALAMLVGFLLLTSLKVSFSIGLPIISLIGLALLASGYLTLSRQPTSSWVQFLLTTSFGFIHGFGFAEVLREIGLPSAQLGIALFSFNIGVEIGQLVAFLLVSPIIYFIAFKAPTQFKNVCFQVSLTCVLFMGSYWFISRSLAF